MKRNELLDVARGIAILIVILGHALHSASGNVISSKLHKFILSFQMEYFFAISGFAAVWASRKTFSASMKKHGLHLAVPYLTWVWIFFAAEAVLGIKTWMPADMFGCILVSGFWFLRHLLIIYTVYEACSRLGNPLACLAVGTILILGLTHLPGLESVDRWAFFFMFGYVIHRAWQQFLPGKELTLNLPRQIAVPLVWCGRHSLALYAVHWNVFYVALAWQLYNFHNLVDRGVPFAVVVTGLFLLYLFGSIALIRLLQHSHLAEMLLLGETTSARR